MEGGKGPGFKRRNESRVGNMMVNVVKKWKRKGEKIRWWNQQFIEMVSRALGEEQRKSELVGSTAEKRSAELPAL